MGQKSNPTSLRLEKSNKHFTSCWYSDLSYTLLLGKEFRANAYLRAVFEQFRYPAPLLLSQNLYKGWRGYLLFLNPLRSRNERSRFFHLERFQMPKAHHISAQEGAALKEEESLPTPQPPSPFHLSDQGILSCNSLFLPKGVVKEGGEEFFLQERREKELHSLLLNSSLQRMGNRRLPFFAELVKLDTLSLSRWGVHGQKQPLPGYPPISSLMEGFDENSSKSVSSPSRTHPRIQQSGGEGVSDLEAVLRFSELAQVLQSKGRARSRGDVEKGSRMMGYGVELQTIRAIWEGQNADLLAEEVLYYLGRRIPFRRIKYQIVREMERDPAVKGVRINCSGRLGGRSKKAQKAKTESIQWGQTSLHVFSSKLSFSSRNGVTPFGKVGIKVWICYI
jgi:hypothetical protein